MDLVEAGTYALIAIGLALLFRRMFQNVSERINESKAAWEQLAKSFNLNPSFSGQDFKAAEGAVDCRQVKIESLRLRGSKYDWAVLPDSKGRGYFMRITLQVSGGPIFSALCVRNRDAFKIPEDIARGAKIARNLQCKNRVHVLGDFEGFESACAAESEAANRMLCDDFLLEAASDGEELAIAYRYVYIDSTEVKAGSLATEKAERMLKDGLVFAKALERF